MFRTTRILLLICGLAGVVFAAPQEYSDLEPGLVPDVGRNDADFLQVWDRSATVDRHLPAVSGQRPALIQGSNSDLHLTHDWKRRRIKYVRVPLADLP